MAEFTYNNEKNASTGDMPFELNCGYHPYVSYKENINPCFKFKLADDLASKLREIIAVYLENFQRAQNL